MNVATAAAAAPEKRARKRLIPGQRVSGSVGNWIPNPNPNLKRKRKAKLYGYVVSESGNGKYNVRFDDGVRGICVTDAWKLAHHHNLFKQRGGVRFYQPCEDDCSIRKFAGILSRQLLNFADALKIAPSGGSINPPLVIGTQDATRSTSPLTGCSSSRGGSGSENSARVVSESSRSTESGYTDQNGILHIPVEFQKKSLTATRVMPKRCFHCREEGVPNSGGWARHSCNVCQKSYCVPSAKNNFRDCFQAHVLEIRRSSSLRSTVPI